MKSIVNVLPVFLMVWLAYGWVLSYAQDSFPPLAPQIGTDLVPRGPLDAWERYPSGLLRGKGNKVATIKPGRTYTVTGTKVIEVLLFGDQYYIQIKPAGSEPDWGGEPVWVFQGRQGANLPPNLLPLGTVCKPSSSPAGFDCSKADEPGGEGG